MEEGFAYIAGAMQLDSWLQFCGVKIADGGFVAGEIQRMMKR